MVWSLVFFQEEKVQSLKKDLITKNVFPPSTLYWVDTGLVVGITIFLNTSYNWKACGKHDTKAGGYFFLCWNIVNNEYICFIFVYIKSIYTFFYVYI